MAQRNVNNGRALWRRAVKRNLADLVGLLSDSLHSWDHSVM